MYKRFDISGWLFVLGCSSWWFPNKGLDSRRQSWMSVIISGCCNCHHSGLLLSQEAPYLSVKVCQRTGCKKKYFIIEQGGLCIQYLKQSFGRWQALSTHAGNPQKDDMILSCYVGFLIIDEWSRSIGQQLVEGNTNKFSSTYMKLFGVFVHLLSSP